MPRGQSLYLDLLRFLLAVEVLLAHASYNLYTGPGFLWRTFPLAQTAVIGFFVLSGFVIGYVTDTKEKTGSEYAAARISRLWSMIPIALILTLVLDAIGFNAAPERYMTSPINVGSHQEQHYLLSFLLLNRFALFTWLTNEVDLSPGSNFPFWSLSIEGAYYLAFGILLFYRGAFRILVLVALGLLAGPEIVFLFPVWLLGVAAYRLRHYQIPSPLAWMLFLSTPLMLLVVGWARGNGNPSDGWEVTRRWTHLDYAEGLLFAINIFAAGQISRSLHVLLGPLTWAIRPLGNLTFALYLLHRPLLQVLSIYSIADPSSWAQWSWLFGINFLAAAVSAYLCEKLRPKLREWLLHFTRPIARPSS